jgi:phospholipid/cholesterol/gamma-HCH transport system substrate-binding protein
MMRRPTFGTRWSRLALAVTLAVVLSGGAYAAIRALQEAGRTHIVAYFSSTNGVFPGDDVRIRGVNVGSIESIEPEPDRVKVSFWVDAGYQVPADVMAVILSPTLVTARAIQLTPPYRAGAQLEDHAVIDQARTAVPVEWDDFRSQLEVLSDTLQPTESGGVSTLGAFVDTAADNLRGQGPAIREAIVELSQSLSALGDHSGDTFGTVKDLATLVSALQGSTDLIRQLNGNLASVTGLLANGRDEVGHAVEDLGAVVSEVRDFTAANREALGTSADKIASVSQALVDSRGDLEQVLHIAPTTLANFINIYQPAQGTLSGVPVINNFANPISFVCGAIQAASRMNAEQSSKLCVQYLAPIVKNRQMNFLPLGVNPFVGASVRPNEVTYSEDWMRPDYIPPPPPVAPSATPAPAPMAAEALPGADALPPLPQSGDPSAGLTGMMTPPEGDR